MKKYVLLFTLLMGGLYSYSQNLDNVRKLLILKQYEKAKPEIDTYLSDPKNAAKAEAWYYKAFIYNTVARIPTKTVAESLGLYQTAYDALKKYAELDPKAPLTTEENNATAYNIYYGFYDMGIKTYNEKNFSESFNLFKKTLEVHDYIYGKKLPGAVGLTFTSHDTDVVWNLAILANELKNKNDALVYYQKIADAGLKDEKYATAYDELVLKYKREKNAEQFAKYVAAAKKNYPVDLPYWENQEIEFALIDLENEALFAKYEELTQKLPNNYPVFYNYAVEIDKFLNTSAATGKNTEAYRKKINELFKKALAIKSTTEVNLQLANLYYSKAYDFQEQAGKIKGTKPAEVKLKNELTASAKTSMSDAIPYAEEAVKQLATLKEYKFGDKVNYKLALEILSNAYKMSGNAAKAAEYEKKKAEVDKL